MSLSEFPSDDPTAAGPDAVDAPLIGERLRAARLSQRRTVSEVALASGLTKGFLSKLERDRASASVGSLIRLCQVLGISIGSLFEAHTGELVRRDEYPVINFGGESMTEYLITPLWEQRLQAIISEIGPGGGSGDELYSLPAEVEFALILSGTLIVELDAHEHTLEQGDALTFSATAPHAFRNPQASAITRVLWVFAPALPASQPLNPPVRRPWPA